MIIKKQQTLLMAQTMFLGMANKILLYNRQGVQATLSMKMF